MPTLLTFGHFTNTFDIYLDSLDTLATPSNNRVAPNPQAAITSFLCINLLKLGAILNQVLVFYIYFFKTSLFILINFFCT